MKGGGEERTVQGSQVCTEVTHNKRQGIALARHMAGELTRGKRERGGRAKRAINSAVHWAIMQHTQPQPTRTVICFKFIMYSKQRMCGGKRF